MANRHVQKILSPRLKTSNINSEREAFEKFQTICISKAVSPIEYPLKEKHVRRIIIGTFQEKNGYTFWHIIRKMSVHDNPIVCWKFCHVLHKLLREGYRKIIVDSYNYREWILDLSKMWGLLKEGYGKLIQNYCTFLVNKIEFHIRNPKFPGNLQITDDELNNMGEDYVNVFFQLSCEIFDYLDEILCLQSSIFASLDMSRSSSMTNHGQCKLAPLIPCIQDSTQLYDFSVKVLFKLHAVLLPDTLEGHRTRFLNQFKMLKQFYISSSNLQYFRNLIQITLLPQNPPNFLLASDLKSHVTPVVILPSEVNSSIGNEFVDNLVNLDFDDNDQNQNTDEKMFDNENYCNQLKTKLNGNNQNKTIEDLKQKIIDLEMNAVELEQKLTQSNMEKENYFKERDELKAELSRINLGTDILIEKEKALEKFNKMKDFYNTLREEHIDLLRKKAVADKEIIQLKSNYEKLVQANNFEKESNINAITKEEFDNLSVKHITIKDLNNKLLKEVSIIKTERDEINETVKKLKKEAEHIEVVNQTLKYDFNEKLLCYLSTFINLVFSETKLAAKKLLEEDNTLDNFNVPNLASTNLFFKKLSDFKSLIISFTEDINVHRSIKSMDEKEIVDFYNHFTKKCFDLFYALFCLFQIFKTVQQSITDFNIGEDLNISFKELVNAYIKIFENLLENDKHDDLNESLDNFNKNLSKLVEMENIILPQLNNNQVQNLQEILLQELDEMDKTIKEAISKIENMLEISRKTDKDIKLEVNESILESCTNLMQAIIQLVNDSRLLQEEIVLEGKGTFNTKEFYQKNHCWTEGLISASKVVAFSAKLLVDSADQFVTGKTEFASIIVASQEIAAANAQLVAASRVKASSKSLLISKLLKSSKLVNVLTGKVIATSKNCNDLLNQNKNNNKLEDELKKLTIHKAKKLEMECQLNIIKLENELTNERFKLSRLRQIHYHLVE